MSDGCSACQEIIAIRSKVGKRKSRDRVLTSVCFDILPAAKEPDVISSTQQQNISQCLGNLSLHRLTNNTAVYARTKIGGNMGGKQHVQRGGDKTQICMTDSGCYLISGKKSKYSLTYKSVDTHLCFPL